MERIERRKLHSSSRLSCMLRLAARVLESIETDAKHDALAQANLAVMMLDIVYAVAFC